MARRLSVRADLAFTVEVPGQHTVHGHLRGAGRRLLLVVDRPEVFASRADSGAVRVLAEGLAQRGLTIEVRQGDTHLITMGDTVAPWWQRRATGSRHIRLGSLRGVWTSARSRFGRGAAPVLPDGGLVPPGTLLPLVPTFRRRVRQPVATTHDPARGGRPRLVVVKPGGYQPGERQRVFWLTQEVTTIGSGEDCGLRLSGLADLHVEIVHDDQDEYVVRSHDPDVRVNGAQVREQFLRTGSRLQLGPWTFAYSREEYADHGRPYGGRIGGELGHQQPQPPRRRLQDDDREVT
jgi:hypothetical protein